MEYNFTEIENKWQKKWAKDNTYKVVERKDKQKFYVLNMFPYPSGAGLHVGHPLGYIASDIYARYKRLKGFNVLNPMGYDAYGLPAEQYAIQTGQHPAITTTNNIKRYREQLDKIGFSFDWDREIKTCEPTYYKWTQWAFIKLFESYYDNKLNKAMSISVLEEYISKHGTSDINAAQSEYLSISAAEFNAMNDLEKQQVLMNYRIAYIGETMVNWCEELGTVLANDEVSEGVSIRGGYPVIQKKMKQWCLRVSSYAQRLLDGLDNVDWSDSLKETQRNWIGRSEGAEMVFQVKTNNNELLPLTIFTTRADTIFGVTFMVLSPENEYINKITTKEQEEKIAKYIAETKKKTERERISNKQVSGEFTGAYAINPLTNEEIPVWISDYVLSTYGTGAIMAVPAHDSRDYAFAKHFNLPITPLIEGADVCEQSYDAKEGIIINSPKENNNSAKLNLNGLNVKQAIEKTKQFIEDSGLGKIKVNYKLRDAIFSRQRYWGEPFPIYYKNGMPYPISEDKLPLELPEIDKYEPTKTGEPPLGRADKWAWNEKQQCVTECKLIDNETIFPIELSTMPGFAGSCAYYLRYMDPHNNKALVSNEAVNYWQNVDLYIGGTEHATGHLIYSRFWNKFLFDIGAIAKDEPFNKLLNQGMIQGRSNFVYRVNDNNHSNNPVFVSLGLKDQYNTTQIHVDVNIVSNDILDIDAFREWRPEYKNAEFILENDTYKCGWAIEKMSKSMFNVVNPDTIISKYGADTLRFYEMFLGPIEQSKPWDTNGIDGCSRFLKKFWSLFYDREGRFLPDDAQQNKEQLKSIHKLIKKVTTDIENFSYNTSVSAFMICVSELSRLKCTNKELLKTVVILLSPFAPHISEELWEKLGETSSIFDANWPEFDEKVLEENEMQMTVSFNGKARFQITLPSNADAKQIEKMVMEDERTSKYIDRKTIIKTIIVPNKIINIVLK